MDKLVLQGIGKTYGDAPVVRGVDMTVHDGDIVAWLGPSGCGKTTLLWIIAGLLSPSEGRVLINGVDVTAVPANKRSVGVVFQSYALFPHMTVSQNILFGPQNQRLSTAEGLEILRSVLELTRLEQLAHRYPAELSGGQQQRVALARALAVKPALILLDEPFSNLDAKVRETMRVELGQFLRRIRATAVIVTHDQEDASHISDRVMVMRAGMTQQTGRFSDLYQAPSNAFVAHFLGHSNWIAGKVISQDAGTAVLDVAGNSWRVCAPQTLDPSKTVAVVFRRNAIRTLHLIEHMPSLALNDCNHLQGVVEKCVDLGPKTLVWMNCEGELLPVESGPEVHFEEGSSVVAALEPSLCFAFPERP